MILHTITVFTSSNQYTDANFGFTAIRVISHNLLVTFFLQNSKLNNECGIRRFFAVTN